MNFKIQIYILSKMCKLHCKIKISTYEYLFCLITINILIRFIFG